MRDDLERLCAGPRCSAAQSLARVPSRPGYYAIYVDDATALPSPYSDALNARATRLIYLGIATVSLNERLAQQDLRHQRPSTFFRGIGSILGYRPAAGSLIGRSNQNNYKFSAADTMAIIRWISERLAVNWIEEAPALTITEKALIRGQCPLINTTHNPEALPALAALRLKCRTIARTR